MNDIAIEIERVDFSKILDEEIERARKEAAERGPECECLHDPDGIEVQDWDRGWECGEPATHRVFTECDCGADCPNRAYVMCRSCVDGAVKHGGVFDVQPL